jgi:hypothetical protein
MSSLNDSFDRRRFKKVRGSILAVALGAAFAGCPREANPVVYPKHLTPPPAVDPERPGVRGGETAPPPPPPPPVPAEVAAEIRFPDRIPTPTSTYSISLSELGLASGGGTLGSVESVLDRGVRSMGFSEIAYFPYRNGFAMVTRVEQIDAQGLPLPPPNRWSASIANLIKTGGVQWWKALVVPTPGHFRVTIFVVDNQPISADGGTAGEESIQKLLLGPNALSPEITNRPINNTFVCEALVYEYTRRTNDTEAIFSTDPLMLAHDVLVKQGFFAPLTPAGR